MSKQKKGKSATLQMSSEVAREIRQHARSNSKTEVCGILIGSEVDDVITIAACIAGENAAQGGSHVTFTQDTWEHIYKIKDRDFPDQRIVGWYHSHPGFGVFLSDHDTFIHSNFFSSPQQVAWVYDPHSDEEGCFGWRGQRIERLAQFAFVDSRGGETAGGEDQPHGENLKSMNSDDSASNIRRQVSRESDDDLTRLTHIVSTLFSHLAIFILGAVLVWYLFPRILLMPVPVDPNTGRPIQGLRDVPSLSAPSSSSPDNNPNRQLKQSEPSQSGGTKRNDGHN